MAHHVPACSSRRDEEWGRLLVEEREGAPLYVIRLYGGGLWNEAGPCVQVRHIARCRSGRRQQGVVQQLTEVPVYRNGERLGGQGFQEVLWHGATITFGTPFPRATLVTHVVEINPLFLQLSLNKRRQRPRALPTSLAPPAADPPRGPPPTGVKVVLCALVATSPSNSSWAIVAAESYRLASHGPPLHTGLVALRGTWPVSSVAQLGRGTVAYAHGPLPKPAPCEAQYTRTLQLHLVVEDALRLAHDEGAGVARPLCRHATPLPHFVEPSSAAPPDPAAQLAAVQVTLDECDRRLAHLHSAPGPTTWGAMLGLPSEEAQREQRLAEVLEIAGARQAAEARHGELVLEATAQSERRAAAEARRVAAKRAREATAQEERLMGRHPPRHLARAKGQLARMWGPA